MNNKKSEPVTLGQILDLIDKNRTAKDEFIHIRDGEESRIVCSAAVCWEGWKYLEHRIVGCIQMDSADNLSVWLHDEPQKEG